MLSDLLKCLCTTQLGNFKERELLLMLLTLVKADVGGAVDHWRCFKLFFVMSEVPISVKKDSVLKKKIVLRKKRMMLVRPELHCC